MLYSTTIYRKINREQTAKVVCRAAMHDKPTPGYVCRFPFKGWGESTQFIIYMYTLYVPNETAT